MSTTETHRLAVMAPVAAIQPCRAIVEALVPTGWQMPPFTLGVGAGAEVTHRVMHTACTPQFAALLDWAEAATDAELGAALSARGVTVPVADVRAVLSLLTWLHAAHSEAAGLVDTMLADNSVLRIVEGDE